MTRTPMRRRRPRNSNNPAAREIIASNKGSLSTGGASFNTDHDESCRVRVAKCPPPSLLQCPGERTG